ncbi:MAG: hypothetical protein GF364_15790 [Candidatus Lokiarchaeota archaeon]|nr:hypothetical protein [Candidatus Lokiarchaeota archaeon]
MVLFELGFLKSGMVFYEKTFYKILNLNKMSDATKGQFFDAFFNLIESSTEDTVSTMKFKKYNIVFKQFIQNIPNYPTPVKYLIYAIGDPRMDVTQASLLLAEIVEYYKNNYASNTDPKVVEEIPENSEFDKKVSEIIGDFYSTAIERMMHLFFSSDKKTKND